MLPLSPRTKHTSSETVYIYNILDDDEYPWFLWKGHTLRREREREQVCGAYLYESAAAATAEWLCSERASSYLDRGYSPSIVRWERARLSCAHRRGHSRTGAGERKSAVLFLRFFFVGSGEGRERGCCFFGFWGERERGSGLAGSLWLALLGLTYADKAMTWERRCIGVR